MKERKRRSVLQNARADGDGMRRPPGHSITRAGREEVMRNPAQPPALVAEQRSHIDAHKQEAKDATALVVELESQLREQRAKAAEAQSALRSAQPDISRAVNARRTCYSSVPCV